jgi:putative ABC transport system permease protein
VKPLLLVSLALRSIRRSPARSFLTMLGVVIGVASVGVMVAIGQGAKGAIESSIASLGSNLIVVTPGSSNRGGVSGGAGTMNRLTLADAELLAREGTLLSAVSPVVVTRSTLVGGEANWRASVYGVDVTYEKIRAWPVTSGRFFTAEEVAARRKVVLVGATVAEALFPGQDPVGQSVRVGDVPLEIIGLLERKGQTAEGTDQDDVVLAPYTTVQARLAGRQFIAQILASAWTEGDVTPALDEVRTLVRESHGLAPTEDADFEVRDQRQLATAAAGTTRVMTWLLGAVASVSLVVGGIGIMNIMLVSVTERTREIGIRRAVGARRADVLSQFLVESIVLSGLGGLIGAGIGIGASYVVRWLTGWSTDVTLGTVLIAIGFSGAVGVFFGWFPARRAAALDVIDALRHQ